DCTAVGDNRDSSSNFQGLLLRETDGSWAAGVKASLPANADSGPEVFLNSVSCPSTGNCAAVGSYNDTSGNTQGLMLSATAATPTVATTAPASGQPGSAIAANSITATLTGGIAPTGTITFKVYGPQPAPPVSCASGGTTLGSASVSGKGIYHPS